MKDSEPPETIAAGRALRLGTRGSPLARAQAALTIAALAAAHGKQAPSVETVILSTIGDRVQDRPLAEIGGKALWTRELDAALLDGRIDFGVHSLKDVETGLAPGTLLAAMLPRASPGDRIVGAASLADIPAGATVGTSSPRRAAQLLARRPDLRTVPLRGNVETRLRHIAEGTVAATFLASAGLERLGIDAGAELPLEDWLPAASQGVVAITARADDEEVLRWLSAIDHAPTRAAAEAERAVLTGLGGSCHSAMAVHAAGTPLTIRAELLSPDGRHRTTGEMQQQPQESATDLGLRLASELLANAHPAIRATLG